ncbi:hypothetical protein N7468_000764 [Penicillium chermesinum]|uniref:Uncharacterized protein n=1 Tax=Penicillium chermesinum TaxID=63820 RepID=A0A9W9PKV0_9EURO|nr:uncharacterized protein N7468_000764 [Penicillium chermesinum]KAJ5249313.1 hypothetical protein N7468_000764 [Penicillium chermesinum]
MHGPTSLETVPSPCSTIGASENSESPAGYGTDGSFEDCISEASLLARDTLGQYPPLTADIEPETRLDQRSTNTTSDIDIDSLPTEGRSEPPEQAPSGSRLHLSHTLGADNLLRETDRTEIQSHPSVCMNAHPEFTQHEHECFALGIPQPDSTDAYTNDIPRNDSAINWQKPSLSSGLPGSFSHEIPQFYSGGAPANQLRMHGAEVRRPSLVTSPESFSTGDSCGSATEASSNVTDGASEEVPPETTLPTYGLVPPLPPHRPCPYPPTEGHLREIWHGGMGSYELPLAQPNPPATFVCDLVEQMVTQPFDCRMAVQKAFDASIGLENVSTLEDRPG